ncbi:hypothetical protein N0V82_002187 [Gnomoniopsis sp. IMI 355080]|nr:hypothetical protein N0V82_002187 [Gnomoniopsis sp. IMI 355080]
MFLFEGKGKAVLYTGDIRSEPWHVNAFARSPCMVEYSFGLKTLDKVYLDTSFTEDVVFQAKAEGLSELIGKVSKYPKETVFHFSAWTYGYEEVWIALAKALGTRIHVDDYKLNVYKALQIKLDEDHYVHLSPEAPTLTGYTCGNRFQPGILTRDESARLHSCEKGTHCATMAKGDVVWITPIVAHLSSTSDMAEIGIGGGIDDLENKDELVLSPEDAQILFQSLSVSESKDLPQNSKDVLPKFLLSAASAQRPITLNLAPRDDEDNSDTTGLQRALKSLTDASGKGRGQEDVGITIKGLFGDYCSGNVFHHDEYMTEIAGRLASHDIEHHQSQTSVDSAPGSDCLMSTITGSTTLVREAELPGDALNSSQATTASRPSVNREIKDDCTTREPVDGQQRIIDLTLDSEASQSSAVRSKTSSSSKRSYDECVKKQPTSMDGDRADESTIEDTNFLVNSQGSSLSARSLESRRNAFNAMLGRSSVHYTWTGLLSTTNNHTHPESELGEG